jgi:hypothetical protein
MMRRAARLAAALGTGAALLLTPAPTPVQAQSGLPAPVALAGGLPFAGAAPAQLHPAFTWEPGTSPRSRYDLIVVPGALTLIAGPDDAVGPAVCTPVSGDFRAEVYFHLMPNSDGQSGGLFVRAPQSWQTYAGLVRGRSAGRDDLSAIVRDGVFSTERREYLAAGVFMRVERRAAALTLDYRGGIRQDWQPLRQVAALRLPETVEVCLNTASGDARRGITGRFEQFRLLTGDSL